MHIVIFGSSGMVGRGALREALRPDLRCLLLRDRRDLCRLSEDDKTSLESDDINRAAAA